MESALPGCNPMISKAVLCLVGLLAQVADPRYELGWRFKALEQVWIERPDPAARAPVLARWREASHDFFRGRPGLGAAALDQARFELLGQDVPWTESLALAPGARLIDAARTELELEIEALYDAPRPERFQVRLAAENGSQAWSAEVAKLPWRGELPLGALAEGDHRLALEFLEGERVIGRRALFFSVAADVEDRIDELEAAVARLGECVPTLERETGRASAELLDELTWEPSGETDLSGAALLAQAEECLAAASRGESWTGAARAGERWLCLPVGEARVPLRLRVPDGIAQGERRPLVIALHGAGGSENLFFEGYGAGAIVELCAARGWILVAPRVELEALLDVPALVEALAGFLPSDRASVFLVGHSLGAILSCTAVNAAPRDFRAVALLAGAGAVRDASQWRDLPLFIATGERDFFRREASELHQTLIDAGARRTSFRVYPCTEHVTMVGEALPDVFAFFDQTLRRPVEIGK